ncbi:MAG: extracellular solute-binding protein [Spirochaetota bacterium]|nr:MAG: extracellular solute-binding protein [Spirochaetota bacterium]
MKRKFLNLSIVLITIVLVSSFFLVGMKGRKPKKPEEAAVVEEEMQITAQGSGSQKERAEMLGKKYSGTTITMLQEGIAAAVCKAFAVPFKEATGITVEVIEVPYEETLYKPFTEHEAGTGAIDIYRIVPHWIPDLAAAGVIQPIDDLVETYIKQGDMDDVEPGRRLATMLYDDKYWGVLVDGDMFILYYRADIFEDPDAMSKFKAKHGYDLAPPKSWEQFNQMGQFITDYTEGEVYGYAGVYGAGHNTYFFAQPFRGAGGRYFDPDTMEATVNREIGVQTMKQLLAEQKYGPPGMRAWGVGEQWSAAVSGKIAMWYSWPPSGRFAEAASGLANYPAWLPPTKVAGKIKYALLPGPFKGDGSPAAGMMGNGFWCMSSDTKKREAAWAWMMWYHSPEMALKTSMFASSLQDPYRFSQFNDPLYRSLWPNAGMYLDTLREAGKYCVLPTKMLGGTEIDEIIDRSLTAVLGGQNVQSALDEAAEKMDEVVNRLGKDRVQQSYRDMLKLQDEIRALQK